MVSISMVNSERFIDAGAVASEPPEPFVDADEAGRFLSLPRRRVMELGRAGKLPGHPIGDGARRVWRFRLSEIATALVAPQKSGFASEQRASMVRPTVGHGRFAK